MVYFNNLIPLKQRPLMPFDLLLNNNIFQAVGSRQMRGGINIPIPLNSLAMIQNRPRKCGGKISDSAYQAIINPSSTLSNTGTPIGNIIGTVASILLPIVGSYLVKKGVDKVGEILEKKNVPKDIIKEIDNIDNKKINEIIKEIQNDIKDDTIQQALSTKSQAILDRVTKGSGISLLI